MKAAFLKLVLAHEPEGSPKPGRRASVAQSVKEKARAVKQKVTGQPQKKNFQDYFNPLIVETSSFSFKRAGESSQPRHEEELSPAVISSALTGVENNLSDEDPLSQEQYALMKWGLLLEDLAKKNGTRPLTPKAMYDYARYLHEQLPEAWAEKNADIRQHEFFAIQMLTNLTPVSVKVMGMFEILQLGTKKEIEQIDREPIQHEIIKALLGPGDLIWPLRQEIANGLFLAHALSMRMFAGKTVRPDEQDLSNFVVSIIRDEYPQSFEYGIREFFDSEEAALCQFIFRRMSQEYQNYQSHPAQFLMQTYGGQTIGEAKEVDVVNQEEDNLKKQVQLDIDRIPLTIEGNEIGQRQYGSFTEFLKNNVPEPVQRAALTQLTQTKNLWSGGIDLFKKLIERQLQIAAAGERIIGYTISLGNEGLASEYIIFCSLDRNHLYVDCSVKVAQLQFMKTGEFVPTIFDLDKTPLEYRIEISVSEDGEHATIKTGPVNWDNFAHFLTEIASKVRKELNPGLVEMVHVESPPKTPSPPRN